MWTATAAFLLGSVGSAAATVPQFSPVPPAPAHIVLRPQQNVAPSCVTARHCLLLGTRGRTAVLGAYDGRALRVLGKAPAAADALSCPTARFCMLAGPTEIGGGGGPLRGWTRKGGRWRTLAMPQPPRTVRTTRLAQRRRVPVFWYFDGLSCGSPRSCVAVGEGWSYGADDLHPPRALIERWDGRRWHRDRPADPIGGLTSVSCPSAGVCMAVGETDDNRNRYIARPEWLRGGRWSAESLPQIAGARGAEVGDVSCPSAHRCVAVGGATTRAAPGDPSHDEAIIAGWNGSTWSAQPLALMGGVSDEVLNDVSCPPGRATTCTATGSWGRDASLQGGAFVAQIPASGPPEELQERLPTASDLPLDCPTESFCLATGPSWALRAG